MPQTFNVGARSLFVTLVAWAFIVLSAIVALCALMQQAMLASFVPAFLGASRPLPAVTGLLLAYQPWVLGVALAASFATLAAAWGVLWRLEWARRAFIGLLVAAIVANLAGLWIQHEVVQSLVGSTLSQTPLSPAAAGVVGGFATAAQALALAITLAGCGLLVWIIRRLMSPSVRQEFA